MAKTKKQRWHNFLFTFKQTSARPEDHAIFNSVMHWSRAVVFGARATTAQLHSGRGIFEFDQGHMTKNQPITVLVLMSESLGM